MPDGSVQLVLLRSLIDAILPNLDSEYPNRIIYDAQRDLDWQPPRRRHPVFFGSYDWHSSVHSHWALVRMARMAACVGDRQANAAAVVERCSQVLRPRLTEESIERELEFFAERPSFSLPYGLSWAAMLSAELAAAAREDAQWQNMARALVPLSDLALDRLERWVQRLPVAIRSGEHSQSAAAMVLAHEAAMALGKRELAALLLERGLALHLADRDCALHLEPSAWDFVSPTLGAAWLMSRCLPAGELAAWLQRAAPTLGREPLAFSPSADRDDGKLAHWDGLLWSRAWMMRALAAALPPGDDRVEPLRRDATAHAAAASQSLTTTTSYAGLHWLTTFAAVWHTGGIEIELGDRAALTR
jgi:Protein of unknown function (DUF2891)